MCTVTLRNQLRPEKRSSNTGTAVKSQDSGPVEKSNEVPPEPFALTPPRPQMIVYFAAHFFMLYTYNLWAQMALFYAITWSVNPFSDWRDMLWFLKISVTESHKGVPFCFKVYGPLYLYWKIFFCYPVETVLWYLDDLLFPEYQATEIKEPLFLLGQPRSGTTMFESLLSEDVDRHCSMLLYEMRYPYLTIQYAVDLISNLDKRILGGKGYRFLADNGFLSCLPEKGERKEMRRLRWDLPDEDDLVFFFHTFCHFLFLAFYPCEEMVRYHHRFSDLPQNSRMRYMHLHRKAIQKVMYRRGRGKRYLAKWVAGWNGQLDMAKEVYPDAKYVVIVREPKESLRSWLKLQGLLAHQFSGNNIMKNHPNVREETIKENIRWFHREIEFCRSTSREDLLVLRYTDIVKDIPQQVKLLYHFLDQCIEKESQFHSILLNQKRKQIRHKRTQICPGDELISTERIEADFPDLFHHINFSY